MRPAGAWAGLFAPVAAGVPAFTAGLVGSDGDAIRDLLCCLGLAAE